MEIALYIALAFGFYMAWSIGANDAANALGTSVGSGAVTFKEAVLIAAVFEFSGALIAGADVTNTMRKGIIDPALFSDPLLFPAGNGADYFVCGMIAALIAAALWIHIAAYLGWPVSTTHSIVGAITGFGCVAVGVENVEWMKLAKIVASWGTSPIIGGVISFFVFTAIRKFIMEAKNPNRGLQAWAPAFSFPVFAILAGLLFTKGLKHSKTMLAEAGIGSTEMIILALIFGFLGSLVVAVLVRRVKILEDDDGEEKNRKIEKVFRYLQIITACFVAFAHGSNDVANSIGPLAAVVNTLEHGVISAKVPVPFWVLLLGGVGIIVGLATYGYKVIETIGTKITEITPSRGFAAEFGAATTILIGTKMGIPLSTTHTIVGAVIGVGFARGINALNLGIIWTIAKSWVYTIPFTAGLTIILYYLLSAILV